jgi:hypothetical protein
MKQSDRRLAVIRCLCVLARIAYGFITVPSPSSFSRPTGALKQLLAGAPQRLLAGAPGQSKDSIEHRAWDHQCKKRTQQIVKYGNDRDWMAILTLFHEEGHSFNEINFSTAIAQLAKIRSLNSHDTLFLQFLKAMETNLLGPDEDPRCYANVAHALAKLNLRNNESTERVFGRLVDAAVAKRFVDNGAAQEIANTA